MIYLPGNTFCVLSFWGMEVVGFIYVILGLFSTYGGKEKEIGKMQPMPRSSSGNSATQV